MLISVNCINQLCCLLLPPLIDKKHFFFCEGAYKFLSMFNFLKFNGIYILFVWWFVRLSMKIQFMKDNFNSSGIKSIWNFDGVFIIFSLQANPWFAHRLIG